MSEATDGRAWGAGLASVDSEGAMLDVWFLRCGVGEAPADLTPPKPGGGQDEVLETRREPVLLSGVRLDRPPADLADGYLRLHLLSLRRIRPRQVELEGLFGVLSNNAWTDLGPVAAEKLDEARWRAAQVGRRLFVNSLDKFPRLADYVTPSGVRIADTSRVRLGAHLAEGTTVMHEGFVNFNAGTLGNSMVEGRISAGVVVGEGSDVGGGASIMGTLSGGGTEVVSIGRRCLVGANAGVGISLGDDCVVAAGCYVTAGAKVTLPDGSVVKARELSGRDNLMYWVNSASGVLEARPRSGSWGELNAELHRN